MRRVSLVALIGIAALPGLLAPIPLERAGAQEATAAADCPATTAEENKEIVRRWYEALSDGSPAEVAALATAPNVVFHYPSPDQRDQFASMEDWARARQEDYRDLEITVEQIIAEGDMVATYQRYSGIQQGNREGALDIPVTGRATEWVSMVLFHIECGKIAEMWGVADDLGRLRRLGVITDAEMESAEVATPVP